MKGLGSKKGSQHVYNIQDCLVLLWVPAGRADIVISVVGDDGAVQGQTVKHEDKGRIAKILSLVNTENKLDAD